jgi:hypothetical protein
MTTAPLPVEVDAVAEENVFTDVNSCATDRPARVVEVIGSVSVGVPSAPVGGVIRIVPLVALPSVIVPSVPLAPRVIVEE